MQMQLPVLVSASRDFFQSASNKATLSRAKPFDARNFTRRKVLRKILQRSDVLADELADVLPDLPRRGVDLFPRARARRDQIRDQYAGHKPVGDALSGIAADDEDMVLIRAMADEPNKVDGLEHLT